MRVMISGGGRIGYFLAKALQEWGHEVTLIIRERGEAGRVARQLPERESHSTPRMSTIHGLFLCGGHICVVIYSWFVVQNAVEFLAGNHGILFVRAS